MPTPSSPSSSSSSTSTSGEESTSQIVEPEDAPGIYRIIWDQVPVQLAFARGSAVVGELRKGQLVSVLQVALHLSEDRRRARIAPAEGVPAGWISLYHPAHGVRYAAREAEAPNLAAAARMCSAPSATLSYEPLASRSPGRLQLPDLPCLPANVDKKERRSRLEQYSRTLEESVEEETAALEAEFEARREGLRKAAEQKKEQFRIHLEQRIAAQEMQLEQANSVQLSLLKQSMNAQRAILDFNAVDALARHARRQMQDGFRQKQEESWRQLSEEGSRVARQLAEVAASAPQRPPPVAAPVIDTPSLAATLPARRSASASGGASSAAGSQTRASSVAGSVAGSAPPGSVAGSATIAMLGPAAVGPRSSRMSTASSASAAVRMVSPVHGSRLSYVSSAGPHEFAGAGAASPGRSRSPTVTRLAFAQPAVGAVVGAVGAAGTATPPPRIARLAGPPSTTSLLSAVSAPRTRASSAATLGRRTPIACVATSRGGGAVSREASPGFPLPFSGAGAIRRLSAVGTARQRMAGAVRSTAPVAVATRGRKASVPAAAPPQVAAATAAPPPKIAIAAVAASPGGAPLALAEPVAVHAAAPGLVPSVASVPRLGGSGPAPPRSPAPVPVAAWQEPAKAPALPDEQAEPRPPSPPRSPASTAQASLRAPGLAPGLAAHPLTYSPLAAALASAEASAEDSIIRAGGRSPERVSLRSPQVAS